MTDLVSVDWLHSHLNEPDLIILDASISKVSDPRTSKRTETIPTALFFDLKNKFSDQDSSFPNTIPTPEQFEIECQKLGINQSSKIVVFDNLGIYSSPRTWWLFKVMGHKNVAVLNGGLPKWKEEGFETTSKYTTSSENGNFKSQFNKDQVKSYQDVLRNINQKSFLVVDARSKERFSGMAVDPRNELKSGSIPNSTNLHYAEVLNGVEFKSKPELIDIFRRRELIGKELVYSCGSGVTACIIMLAGEIAFQKGKLLYDGSWTEWATLQNLKTS